MRWNSSIVVAPRTAPPSTGCGAARALYHGFEAVRGSVEGFERRRPAFRHDGLLFLLFGRLRGLFLGRSGGGRHLACRFGSGLGRRRRWWRRIGEVLLLLAQRY